MFRLETLYLGWVTMPRAATEQRRDSIARLVASHGAVTVEELAQQYAVSEVSIRKDLSHLEASGLCIRRLGGAIAPAAGTAQAPPQHPRKQAIADLAATLIRADTRIILDSGSTTRFLLPHLTRKKGLKVMTNSLSSALALTQLHAELTVLMPGGTWDSQTESFQGQLAEQMLRCYDFDQLFIGADGLDLNRGTTTFSELMSLSRVMAEVSGEVIVMAESWKLGRKMPNQELAWSQVDTLVTDGDLAMEHQQAIKQMGVTVLTAQLENSACVEL